MRTTDSKDYVEYGSRLKTPLVLISTSVYHYQIRFYSDSFHFVTLYVTINIECHLIYSIGLKLEGSQTYGHWLETEIVG